MTSETVLVVLSGGQDSTTCLYWAKQQGFTVHAITFDYGQRHQREIDSAITIAALAEVASHEVVELGPILKGSSPLVSNNELEQYKDHASLPGGLEKTFVPMRNQLFLTVAANRAYVLGASHLVTGVCEEDYGGYPDCRSDFIRKFQESCNAGTFTGEPGTQPPLNILTPLMHLTKMQSVLLAVSLPGCYGALAYSHTAYDGAFPPLGNDHATLLRAKGFEQAGVPDPLLLRAVMEGYMEKEQLPESDNYSEELVNAYLPLLAGDEEA